MATPISVKTSQLRGTLSAAIFKLMKGELSTAQATGIALLAKEMNASVQAEVNAAKWAAKAKEQGHDFGSVTRLGDQIIGEISDDPEEPLPA